MIKKLKGQASSGLVSIIYKNIYRLISKRQNDQQKIAKRCEPKRTYPNGKKYIKWWSNLLAIRKKQIKIMVWYTYTHTYRMAKLKKPVKVKCCHWFISFSFHYISSHFLFLILARSRYIAGLVYLIVEI